MSKPRQLCTFYLDGLLMGVDVCRVQEVILHHELTRVPLAPLVVRGLMNLRGHIVTALDMRRRLELNDLPEGHLPVNVVLRTGDNPISLLVDRVGDVVEVSDEQFESTPQTVCGSVRELIRGAYKLDVGLLLELDTDKAVENGIN